MSNTCIVELSIGKIKGLELEDCKIFKGIPFAKANRFEEAEEISFLETFDATKEELNQLQYGTFLDESKKEQPFYYEEFRKGIDFKYDENLLTLNITAPKNANKAPVLVYIHGGGFDSGTIGELPYGPSLAYAKKDIILVSIGYRLNIFGLYRGLNLGLKDLIFGIKWVKEHIEKFGGNPEQIILMGQSAGAMSIYDLILTKKLENIIKGAILISGAGAFPKIFGSKTKEELNVFWDKVMQECGAKSDNEMKTLPAEVLWKSWYKVKEGFYPQVALPAIDKDVLPDVAQNILKRNEELDIPILFGVTSQDYVAPIMYLMGRKLGLDNAKKKKSKVWGYFFDRTPPGNKYKAFHSVDLWYLFGTLDKSWRPFDEIDYKISENMIDYVSNFIYNLDPNGDNLLEWKHLSKKQKGLKVFDEKSDRYAYTFECLRKTLHTFLKDKGPM